MNSSGQPGTTINFAESGILRCGKFEDGKAVAVNTMRTYFINKEKHALPVVSIVTEPETFTRGIYHSNIPFGSDPCSNPSSNPVCKDTVILIHVDFFEPNGEFAWSAPGGLEMMGGWTRVAPKKSVKVSFREKYGQKNIKYPLFPKFGERKYKDFVLRNFGNNWNRDYVRDRLAAELTEGLGIDYMKGRYVAVYYNGNYWGIHDMRERANKNYFDTNYGIEENNLNLFKNYFYVKVGSDSSYWALVEKLENSTDAKANYDLIDKEIDIENFTNYFISQIYFDNRDWPGNNVRMWKTNVPGAKWKYFLFDVDFGFGGEMYYSSQRGNCSMMELVTSTGETCTSEDGWPIHYSVSPVGKGLKTTIIMIKLLENPDYRKYFREQAEKLLTTNFEPTRVKAKVDELMAELPVVETDRDKDRWNYNNPYWTYTPSTTNNTLKDWVTARSAKVQAEMKSYFKSKWNEDF